MAPSGLADPLWPEITACVRSRRVLLKPLLDGCALGGNDRDGVCKIPGCCELKQLARFWGLVEVNSLRAAVGDRAGGGIDYLGIADAQGVGYAFATNASGHSLGQVEHSSWGNWRTVASQSILPQECVQRNSGKRTPGTIKFGF